MKFRIVASYRIIKAGAATNHEAQEIYNAADAPMAIGEFLNEITSTAEGIITAVEIKCEIDHSSVA